MDDQRAGIRSASVSDLDFIHPWLSAERVNGPGFICNWDFIIEAQQEGAMSVFDRGGGAVGFLTRGLCRDSILQVRTDHQGQGIGRLLVEEAVLREEANNNAVLVIQCNPRTSIEFWTRMGFEGHREAHSQEPNANVYMHRILTRAHRDVQGNDLEELSIRVYPERALYGKDGMGLADRIYPVMARINEELDVLELAHRVAIPCESGIGDAVVEVFWGHQIFVGKAKHPAAKAVGFNRTPNYYGWYIDQIRLGAVFAGGAE